MPYDWIEHLNRVSGNPLDIDRLNHRLFTLYQQLSQLSNPETFALRRRILGQLIFAALRDSPGSYSGLRLILQTYDRKRVAAGKLTKTDKVVIVNEVSRSRAGLRLSWLTKRYLDRLLSWPCAHEFPDPRRRPQKAWKSRMATEAEMRRLSAAVAEACRDAGGTLVVRSETYAATT